MELVEHIHVNMVFLKVAAALDDAPENFLILPIYDSERGCSGFLCFIS